ncbi:MAG: iron chaperone [Polyangiaceae bacterium]
MSARKKPASGSRIRRDPAIDDYLAGLSPSRRAQLQKLRKTIHAVVPDVEECISYRMPAFRHRGKIIAGFQATSKGCSYYPFSGTTLRTLAAELEGYGKTKSALHFGPDQPLPASVVRKLLEARIAEGPRRR